MYLILIRNPYKLQVESFALHTCTQWHFICISLNCQRESKETPGVIKANIKVVIEEGLVCGKVGRYLQGGEGVCVWGGGGGASVGRGQVEGVNCKVLVNINYI